MADSLLFCTWLKPKMVDVINIPHTGWSKETACIWFCFVFVLRCLTKLILFLWWNSQPCSYMCIMHFVHSEWSDVCCLYAPMSGKNGTSLVPIRYCFLLSPIFTSEISCTIADFCLFWLVTLLSTSVTMDNSHHCAFYLFNCRLWVGRCDHLVIIDHWLVTSDFIWLTTDYWPLTTDFIVTSDLLWLTT